MKKVNFYSGPAILPESVLAKASESVININGNNISILEISHRSEIFTHIMNEARLLVRQLLEVPDNYEVLFLHGGASSQFYMIPYSLLGSSNTAVYTDTGQWAANAIKEAALFGKVHIACSSRSENYSYIPKALDMPDSAAYLHITSNNTVFGTQWHQFPQSPFPLIADMSSDIFSKEIMVSDFDMIYAGAQKNIGPAGVCLVIARKDLFDEPARPVPTMLDYRSHIQHGSMFNTPPVFAVYVCYLTLLWLRDNGGIKAMEIKNQKKAALLYEEIDRNALFTGNVHKEDRSLMNVTFKALSPELEQSFKSLCKDNDLVGLDGYRTVGGFRASIYNAMPLEGVEKLIELMKFFETKMG